jgi:hypothetical protein
LHTHKSLTDHHHQKSTKMKKIYLLTLLTGTTTFAQPIINQSNVTLDVASEVFIAETDGFDPGTAGPNKTWDFSSLTIVPIGTSATTDPSGKPGANLFPTANFCSADTSESPSSFVFFRHNAQKMELLGELYVGIGVINYNANPKTYLEFPYTYNKVINDTYKASFDDLDTAFTTTYDAYGTLILPFGTFNNVVRQKIVENGQTDYIWFHVNPFFPIMQTALADGAIGILKTAVLATDSFHQDQTFSVFPNPNPGAFQINLNNGNQAEISVYDVVGKLVASQKASGQSTTVDIVNCSAGIYFLKVTANNQAAVQKIIKK